MNTTAFSRTVAMVGAVAVVTTVSTTPVAAQRDDSKQRQAVLHGPGAWNNAEGPQPTCPDGRWNSDTKGVTHPTTSPRGPRTSCRETESSLTGRFWRYIQ